MTNLKPPGMIGNHLRRSVVSVVAVYLLAMFGSAATAQDAALAQPTYWTTQWSFEDVDVRKLADRLEAIGIETGLELEGTVSVNFEVGVPLTSLRDAAAYRFDGTLSSPSLSVDGVVLKELRTSVAYRDGIATLENLNSKVIDRDQTNPLTGSIQGTATVQLVPKEDVSGKVVVKDLAVSPLSELIARILGQSDEQLAKDQLPSDGAFSGMAEFSVPLDSAGDIATYKLDGNFNGQGLKLANLPPADFDAKRVRIEDERLLVDQFLLTAKASDRSVNAIRLLGNASLPLTSRGKFQFEVYGDDIPLGKIAAAVGQRTQAAGSEWVSGKIDFQIVGEGELDEVLAKSDWSIQGSVASPGITVAGLELGTLEHEMKLTPTMFDVVPKRDFNELPKSFRLGFLKSRYSINEQSLAVEQFDMSLFDGTISGSATIPFDESGTAIAKANVAGLRPIISLSLASRTVEVSADIEGMLDWQVPLNAVNQPAEHNGRADLSLSTIMIGGEDIGSVQATASADAGKISLNADGKLFDGKVAVKTIANMQANDRWSDLPSRLAETSFDFDDVAVGRLTKITTTSITDIQGFASGKIKIVAWNRQDGSRASIPDVDVVLDLSRFSHRSLLLSRSLNLEGKLRNNIFEVASFNGDYADGSVRARGRVYLIDKSGALHPRGDLRVSASRVNLSKALWFLGETADDFQGRVSASATLAGYQESVRVRGSCDGSGLICYGLPLGKAHSALAGDANIKRHRWNVRFPSVRSSQGGGKVEGELSLASTRTGSKGVDLESRWRTNRVDFFRLTQQIGRSTSLARGEITGDLTLNGKSIRGLDDLSGRFNFALGQTRGAAIPGLLGASQFLGPISLVNQTFDVGQVRGLIGRGAITVDEFWLGSDTALVQADGKIFIRSGRMDLNALIATGDYGDVAANFAQLAQEYALRSLIPASAILDLSELLLDRTLVVRVMGTLQNPIIRVQPVQTFREEAARFLLREGRRLILAGITAGAADGLDMK